MQIQFTVQDALQKIGALTMERDALQAAYEQTMARVQELEQQLEAESSKRASAEE